MRMDEGFELRHEIVVVAERKLEIDPSLGRDEAELVEPFDLVLGELVVGEIGKRRPAPKRKRLAQLRRSRNTLERSSLVKELLEVAAVSVVRRNIQSIAGPDRVQRLLPELLAQARDVSLQRLGRGFRWLAIPQLLDQQVTGNSLSAVQEQNREEFALLTTAQRDIAAAFEDLERPQYQIPQPSQPTRPYNLTRPPVRGRLLPGLYRISPSSWRLFGCSAHGLHRAVREQGEDDVLDQQDQNSGSDPDGRRAARIRTRGDRASRWRGAAKADRAAGEERASTCRRDGSLLPPRPVQLGRRCPSSREALRPGGRPVLQTRKVRRHQDAEPVPVGRRGHRGRG